MSYASKTDMIKRYSEASLIELTDRVQPYLQAINDDVLNAALDDATALINSFVGKLYRLPISAVPSVLVRHTCSIAYYDLHRGRYPDEVRKEYEDTMSYLDKIAKKVVVLDLDGSEPQSALAEARVEGPARIFNRDSLKSF
ncbi:MAG: hypothetical protein DI551_08220 [Micavibrio aeruginosavorus]|uniref:DUF1320 domain-containing protein n=1 Tax=Micavibrio aeruginosavorus TaxID=349221 RepID=A0A2W5PRN3_9BACT|nr:MAG: hypothetical protein DI551_08220 [Micavibrio aeruginosavorus]